MKRKSLFLRQLSSQHPKEYESYSVVLSWVMGIYFHACIWKSAYSDKAGISEQKKHSDQFFYPSRRLGRYDTHLSTEVRAQTQHVS